MTATKVHTDGAALIMTITVEFDTSPQRAWQLWADPHQLERWWGPPTRPATVTSHDLRPGGRVTYHMADPEGDQPRGFWEVVEVEAPNSLVFRDGFADADGLPNNDVPLATVRVAIEDIGCGRSRMTIENRFVSAEAMEQALAMGMEEGFKQAVGQIDALLAEDAEPTTPHALLSSKEQTMPTATTRTLNVPGAILTYDVHQNDEATAPVLLLIGSPMGASGFGTLAGHFPDRTVVTYDPRGVERSRWTQDAHQATPEMHADDLHRLIATLDAGPVDLFASSGGAVNALVLVTQHPEQVRMLVAHEPPAFDALPDRAEAMAASRDIHETYMRHGFGPAMAKFIALVSHDGPVTADYTDRPAPDPAMYGLPIDDDGQRDDPLLAQNMISSSHVQLDFDAIRAASTRTVLAVGVESGGTIASRAARSVAERLGTTPVTFPSDHAGFLGGEYSQTGDPEAFAIKLREVLGHDA